MRGNLGLSACLRGRKIVALKRAFRMQNIVINGLGKRGTGCKLIQNGSSVQLEII